MVEHSWGGIGGGGVCAYGRCGADVAWACGRDCRGVDCSYVRGGGEVDWAYRDGGGGVGSLIADGRNIGSRVSLQSSSFSVKSIGNKE